MNATDTHLDVVLNALSKRGFSFPNRYDQNATDAVIEQTWTANRRALHYALEELEVKNNVRIVVQNRVDFPGPGKEK